MTGGRVKLTAHTAPSPYPFPSTRAITECTGTGCPCRGGKPVHPVILMAFDHEAVEYREIRLACTAVWAAHSAGHEPGRICGEPATHQVADIQLCAHHYRRIREWMNDRDKRDLLTAVENARDLHREEMILARERAEQQRELDKETARLKAEQAKELHGQQVELAQERIRAEEAARAEASLVYYVRRESDGLIKIGTSRTLAKRLVTLKKEHGPLQLIVTEGGNHKEETALHRQFRGLRAEGEWFRPELPLLEHVYALMKQHPTEPAPGLPPVMERRAIGSMIHKIKMAPVIEQRRMSAAEKERRRLLRQQAKQAREAEADVADPAA